MKKLFFICMLFIGMSLSAQTASTGIQLSISKVYVDTVTVGTTPVQAPAHVDAEWVQFTHETSGQYIWLVGDTTYSSVGWGHIGQYDTTERYPVINSNVFWLKGSTAGIKVYMLWGE
jgi:hypothetical protein